MRAKTILVVEDEELLRTLAVSILGGEGHCTLAAVDAIEANRVWEVFGPKIDLLVTDVILPGLNGMDMARAFRKARPDLKIIFITGSVDLEAEIRAFGGVTEFLGKPYAAERLGQVARKLLATSVTKG